MFLVVDHQVCAHLRRDFGPLLCTDTLQILKVCSIVALAGSFGSVSCWKTHSGWGHSRFCSTWPHLSTSQFGELFSTLSSETAPKQNVSTSMFNSGDGVLGVISSVSRESSWCQRAQFWSPPTTLSQVFSESSGIHWQMSDDLYGSLSKGPCGHCRISIHYGKVCYQWFSWWLTSQRPWDHYQVPPL